jgi:hypothetical protein
MGESARDDKTSAPQTVTEQASSRPPDRQSDPLDDKLNIIGQGFLWIDSAAQREIEAVRRELKEADTPSWSEALIEGVIEVALTAMGARCGEVIAKKLLPKAAERLPGEFVKKIFEEGLPAGVAASKGELKDHHKNDLDAFVDSYAAGVSKLHHENQTRFTTKSRHEITSLEEAEQLLDACSDDSIKEIARAHGDACRDGWVTYIEESTFGSMATQEMRNEVNARAPGWLPAMAPSLEGAILGSAEGVLEIGAVLPTIRGNEMEGSPEVKIALLNGVNEATREEYAGRPLAEMNIPRQVRCSVEGEMPSFSLNLNQHGAEVGWRRHAQGEWLRARAQVGRPAGDPDAASSLEETGIKLLLADLVPESIRGKLI